MRNEISEVTRRAIVDYLSTSGADWAGRLQEDDFLARLYEEPTGWQKVDRQLQEIRLRLDTAESEEQ